MEQVPEDSSPPSSLQSRLWKSLQLGKARSKSNSNSNSSGSSGRTGGERRSAVTPCHSPQPARNKDLAAQAPMLEEVVPGMIRWSGLKRREQMLDRVFSSSQPNLCCSVAESLPPSAPCSSPGSISSTPEPGSALRRLKDHLLPHNRGTQARDKDGEGQQHKSPTPGKGNRVSQQKISPLPATDCLQPALLQSLSTKDSDPASSKARGSTKNNNNVGTCTTDYLFPNLGMYQLDVTLNNGTNLAARDRGGTSDPYVKFKIGGKEVFRSKTIHKNLNPVWDEKVCLFIDSIKEPLYVKVFDYDFGLHDDFMGSAFLDLTTVDLNSSKDVALDLRDPQHSDHKLGTIHLTVALSPKDNICIDSNTIIKKNWKRSSKFQTQSLKLPDLHRRSQLSRGIVSITLIEGQELKAMDANGLSDPYVKFRLGHQKYKSKTLPKTLNPQWREQIDMHILEDQGGVIEITVWDKDAGKRDDFIGRCHVDFSTMSKEKTHKLKLKLEEGEGWLVLLVTLTASSVVTVSDRTVGCLEDQNEREAIFRRYSLMRSFTNLEDVGLIQVKVIRAEGLMAADVTGKSDPFCVVEVNNDRLMTHTVYKNLNPKWNKIFTFNIKDIHSVLEVTVYDEDRDRSADFLGKVAVPLLYIQNGEQKAYVLKNKQLTGPTKGVIYLEVDVIFNAVKACLGSLVPKEQKYIEDESRLSKQLLLRNFIRMKRCAMVLVNAAYYINSCFDWDSPQRSLAAFLIFLLVVWNFELYMIPLALLLLLAWNYFLIISGKDNRTHDTVVEDMLEDEEEEDDKDDKDCEKKGFMNKLYAIQEVCVSVQNVLDEVASISERIKNTFNWTVPFLTWLAIIALCLLTVGLYFIPLRYIVLLWGINKFTKKIRSPYMIDNNEIIDFLSRVPSDVQVVQFHELKPDAKDSPSKRKKNNLG
ncbi:multiple C2 and transmembrane domain-containing protein 1 isoform X2 [Xenopus laevis]|uniref:Multiple C2 and transmembrane domain-containing protein 1 isoform X2 n=2 Tax=Xenopus laevis TaxID=8355 RepID=A0A8J0U9J9_XENLA|nr:multiple C2 and transmembrane domain-containing protein 1 isoform X2 [Xenopus laevis]